MEPHDFESESETVAGDFRAQLQRFQQLNEYCDQAVAEIRASLERTQNESNWSVPSLGTVARRRGLSANGPCRAGGVLGRRLGGQSATTRRSTIMVGRAATTKLAR